MEIEALKEKKTAVEEERSKELEGLIHEEETRSERARQLRDTEFENSDQGYTLSVKEANLDELQSRRERRNEEELYQNSQLVEFRKHREINAKTHHRETIEEYLERGGQITTIRSRAKKHSRPKFKSKGTDPNHYKIIRDFISDWTRQISRPGNFFNIRVENGVRKPFGTKLLASEKPDKGTRLSSYKAYDKYDPQATALSVSYSGGHQKIEGQFRRTYWLGK